MAPGSRFGEIQIRGFRRLQDVRLGLPGLSVLIGVNGIGKTSVLDVFSLLAASAQGRLNDALKDLSGLPAILTVDRSNELSLRITMDVGAQAPLEYLLRLRPQGTAYTIEEEILSQWSNQNRPEPFKFIDAHGSRVRYSDPSQRGLVEPNWEYNSSETALSQVPKMYQVPEEFRRRLASCTFYHALNVEPQSPVRLQQPMRPATLPGKDGEDLVSCLYTLRETDPDRFEAIEDSLRTAFPAFERLGFPPVAAGTHAMTWRESTFTQPLYMNQLSEGTLRFLWLATLLQSPGLTALTLLDEPEVSLHPDMLSVLAELLREASHWTQLIVATHSDRLIRFLEPSEVVAVSATDDGMARLDRLNRDDLAQWLDEYSLDELWSRGRIGAR